MTIEKVTVTKMKFVEIVSQMHMVYRHKKYEKGKLAINGMSIHNAFHCILVPVIRLIRKLRNIDLINSEIV